MGIAIITTAYQYNQVATGRRWEDSGAYDRRYIALLIRIATIRGAQYRAGRGVDGDCRCTTTRADSTDELRARGPDFGRIVGLRTRCLTWGADVARRLDALDVVERAHGKSSWEDL